MLSGLYLRWLFCCGSLSYYTSAGSILFRGKERVLERASGQECHLPRCTSAITRRAHGGVGAGGVQGVHWAGCTGSTTRAWVHTRGREFWLFRLAGGGKRWSFLGSREKAKVVILRLAGRGGILGYSGSREEEESWVIRARGRTPESSLLSTLSPLLLALCKRTENRHFCSECAESSLCHYLRKRAEYHRFVTFWRFWPLLSVPNGGELVSRPGSEEQE